ncbi:unnamed protein product [Prorocentrum cordatum]|uniref:Anaphase-promoting complex subunit 1 n=1 Tax=Prorocentrum cordatum TaxID=2364126 RepID=A0ABN9PIB0_9DINO|nr:unnamed protein product [Polarella glacialis]
MAQRCSTGAAAENASTDLTQAIGDLMTEPTEPPAEADTEMPSPAPPRHAPAWQDALLQELIEDGVLQHVGLVQASALTLQGELRAIPFTPPASWDDLQRFLAKLAFDHTTTNPWRALGFGPLDGPEPTEHSIVSRVKLALMLCSPDSLTEWGQVDRDAAGLASHAFATAGARCEEQLPDILKERRRLRPPKLPLMEGEASIATQWSQVSAPASQDHSATMTVHRKLADLLEKGDPKAINAMGNQRIVVWAPSDQSSLQRILSALLREPGPLRRPLSLTFLARLPSFPGVDCPTKLFDLWWHPLLSEKHAPLVKQVDLVLQPVE